MGQAHTIDPISAYKTYVRACDKNNSKAINELDFLRGLCIGISGSLSVACGSNITGITKFPVDEDDEIWCLLVPCYDGIIRIIYGPIEGIDETIDNLQKSLDALSESTSEVEFSSLDQF